MSLLLFCIMGNHLLSSFHLAHGLLSSAAANNKMPKSPPPPPPPSKNNNYYSYKTFKRLTLPALVYSVVSKATARILRLQPNTIIVSNSSTSSSSSAPPHHHHRCGRRRLVAIVTGSNTGVGFETAKSLVQEQGMEVIIACRSMEKGIAACKLINDHSSLSSSPPGAAATGMAVFVEAIDLADLSSSVRTLWQGHSCNNTTKLMYWSI
jgi:hypothetical protein